LALRQRRGVNAAGQRVANAALLMTLALTACSNLAAPMEEMPTAGADPAYNKTVADWLKPKFGHPKVYQAFEISGYRWVHGLKGWSWLACVRFQDHGHPRTYAIFIKDGGIIDNRYAVETDACAEQTYSPFDLATGAITPAAAPQAIGVQQPIY
jgi:hypothetical protein